MLAGAAYVDEREWERTAWLASYVINTAGKSVKHPVTVDRLLGRRKAGAPTMPSDPEQDFAELMRRQAALTAKQEADSG